MRGKKNLPQMFVSWVNDSHRVLHTEQPQSLDLTGNNFASCIVF